MNWKRFTWLSLSIVMFVWRKWRIAHIAQGTELDQNHTNCTLIGEAEPWYAYLPPYHIDSFVTAAIVGEVLLNVLPPECLDDNVLALWNLLIQYEVCYEWEMHVISPIWEDIDTIKLVLTSDIRSVTHVVQRSERTLVISLWFHPRTHFSLARLTINFPNKRRLIADLLVILQDAVLD